MKPLTIVTSVFLVSSLLLATAPTAEAARRVGDTVLTTTFSQCARLAGREKTRCENKRNRAERLRVRLANVQSRGEGYTAREQRRVYDNRPDTNVRRIGHHNLMRIRLHNRGGGRARRQIQRRDEMARNHCRHLDGTAKYMCVRKESRALRRGNTR